MMKRSMKAGLAAAVVVALSTVAVYAAKGEDEGNAAEIAALAQAKITMTQAVTTAEQHANGRAARAEFDTGKAGSAYDIEVVSGAKVFDVKVDANTGAVLASAEDKGDKEHEHEGHEGPGGEHGEQD